MLTVLRRARNDTVLRVPVAILPARSVRMKRRFAAIVVLAGSALLALGRQADVAFACSGPGPIENMLRASVIFEGRVVSVAPTGQPATDRAPHTITFDVVRAFKGAKAGDKISANAMLPIPGKPIMCPQFQPDLAG